MGKTETELCAYSLAALLRGVRGGVDRVELCASPGEQGTSPAPEDIVAGRRITEDGARPAEGLFEAVVSANGRPADGKEPGNSRPADAEDTPAGRRVELSVMVRPRGGDFVYTDAEFAQMEREVLFARGAGADCAVFGLLTPEGDVDTERTRRLVELARPMEVTFHRAFDVARDWRGAMEDIISAGCDRVLTSGQMPSAAEGMENIRRMVGFAAGRIEIMAGAGVSPRNAATLAETGVNALHFSAQGTADPAFIRAMTKKGKQ